MGVSAALSFPQCCKSTYQKKNDGEFERQQKEKNLCFSKSNLLPLSNYSTV